MRNARHKRWWAVIFRELMRHDWKSQIETKCRLVRANGGSNERGLVMVVVEFPTPTTYRSAIKAFDGLSARGFECVYCVQPVY